MGELVTERYFNCHLNSEACKVDFVYDEILIRWAGEGNSFVEIFCLAVFFLLSILDVN